MSLFDSYAAGDWDTPDLYQLMQVLVSVEALFHPLRPLLYPFLVPRNAQRHEYAAVSDHYEMKDIDFRALTLDSAYSATPSHLDPGSLENARSKSVEILLQRTRKRTIEQSSVLDLGCGWGAYSKLGRQTWKAYHGVTLSRAQQEWCVKLGHPSTSFRLGNFLDPNTWAEQDVDVILLIESLEHIRKQDFRNLFTGLRCRYPSALLIVQVTTRSGWFSGLRNRTASAVPELVFPGPGNFPTRRSITSAALSSGYRSLEVQDLTSEYAETLRQWHQRAELTLHTQSDSRRMMAIYLASAAAALGHRTLANYRLIFDASGRVRG